MPGTTTVSSRTWSATHGCVDSDSRPLNSHWSVPATGTAAESSGWPRPFSSRPRAGRASSARAGTRRSAARPGRRRARARASPGSGRSCARGRAARPAPRPRAAARAGRRDGGVGEHPRQRGQRAVGADLDVTGDAERLQRVDAVGEAHRLASVLDPVRRGGDLVAGQLAAEVGDDRQPRRVVGEPLGDRAELVSIGSISREWNAWLTGSRVVLRPCSRQCASSSPIGPAGPATTTARGPLTAARSRCPGAPARPRRPGWRASRRRPAARPSSRRGR